MPATLPPSLSDTAEGRRLAEPHPGEPDTAPWRRWGPYLSERQWGTVREDYSADGDAWAYFPFSHARSRAYRWGEDGLAGFGERHLHWCLGLALWNGRDPILKERLFGLNNAEGNHGEDVKELYSFLDAVPSHAWNRMLYRYPQGPYPYGALVSENARRGLDDPEYEVTDTGTFDGGRYFDVTVTYAKAGPDDILMEVRIDNRGPDPAVLHVLPQLWARNTWRWRAGAPRPRLSLAGPGTVAARHPGLDGAAAEMRLHVASAVDWLFCDNDTNEALLYGHPAAGYPKDAVHEAVVAGRPEAANPAMEGTKVAAWHRLAVEPGTPARLRVRFRPVREDGDDPFAGFDAALAARRAEADAFHEGLAAGIGDADTRLVLRQAVAGLLWSKQFYEYDVRRWLDGDPSGPPPPPERRGRAARNVDWRHLRNRDIISMPDTWEYPWYASWDLAFQAVPFALVDPVFAKQQLLLLVRDWYMHPSAQLPAYEWKFSDANPPTHAWAALAVFRMDQERSGTPDWVFLETVFQRLMLNFTWWVNRKDAQGRNLFQGGFLGLDNIEVFDRSMPLPPGYTLNQSDGTAWVARYALDLLAVAIELAGVNHVYEDACGKLFEHFLYIAEAAASSGGLWDETDGFFYDTLEGPDGTAAVLRSRTMVGLIPLTAVLVIDGQTRARLPAFAARLDWFLANRPELAALVSRWEVPGQGDTLLLSLLRGHRMKMLLARMLDPDEFLSPHGIRSVSAVHRAAPFAFTWQQQALELPYWPAESRSRLFGGNSNWRGPIWMPVNYMLVEALRSFAAYYGEDFRVEYPARSGELHSLREVADALSDRLVGLFRRGPDGRRPVQGALTGPLAEDGALFYEYFHGDTGMGLGASHQTGWTALVALLIRQRVDGAAPQRSVAGAGPAPPGAGPAPPGADQAMVSTTPPSTRSAAPVVAEASGDAT